MTDSAHTRLISERTLDRLSAAREMLVSAGPADLPVVHQALLKETDTFVYEALMRVLERVDASSAENPQTQALDDGEGPFSAIEAKAVEHTSKLYLHEIQPVLGSVAAHAAREFGEDYRSSSTARSIERLLAVVDVLARMADASSTPRVVQIDLTEMINQVLADSFPTRLDGVRLGRTDAVLATADPELAKLALGNVLRNAIESAEEKARRGDRPGPTVISWGRTDRDIWITVIDDGIGLPPGYQQAAEPGTTTKSKSVHLGWGLTVARQAIESMSGEIVLRPAGTGGAECEIRWPLLEDN